MSLPAIAGWGADTLSTLTALVQASRISRRGPDGVSATTWSLFLLMSVFWVAYGTAVRSPQIVMSSILGAPFMIWLLLMLDRDQQRRGLVRAAGMGTFAAVPPTMVLGWNVGLLRLGMLIVATRMPQLTQLVRATHAHAVSTSSWLLGAGGVGLWLGYYAMTGKTFAAITMVAALSTNLAIAALAFVRHQGARTRARLTVALASAA